MMMRVNSHSVCNAALALALLSATTTAIAQPGSASDGSWPPTPDGLESCIIAEERSSSTGHACIGKQARQCLAIAQREPLVTPEKCYEPELRGWAALAKRYFDARPKGDKARDIAAVQRAGITYRDLKCGYVDKRHGGGASGRWLKAICMLEETGRLAIDLRSFRAAQ